MSTGIRRLFKTPPKIVLYHEETLSANTSVLDLETTIFTWNVPTDGDYFFRLDWRIDHGGITSDEQTVDELSGDCRSVVEVKIIQYNKDTDLVEDTKIIYKTDSYYPPFKSTVEKNGYISQHSSILMPGLSSDSYFEVTMQMDTPGTNDYTLDAFAAQNYNTFAVYRMDG